MSAFVPLLGGQADIKYALAELPDLWVHDLNRAFAQGKSARSPLGMSSSLLNVFKLICPPGNSILIIRINVKPPAQKYSASHFVKSEL
jgi:hypothetical protein